MSTEWATQRRTRPGASTCRRIPPLGLRSVRLTGTGVVDRDTYLSVPGPAAVLPLIPTSVDLAAFDEMFRGNGGALWRWTTTPSLLMEMRVLQFTNLTDTASTAAAETMNGPDADGILADLRWGLGQLTGETYRDFANVQRVTANAGDLVSLTHSGVIFVARSKGLRAATGDIGYARWATDGAGRVQGERSCSTATSTPRAIATCAPSACTSWGTHWATTTSPFARR